jgi:hypothetical protein
LNNTSVSLQFDELARKLRNAVLLPILLLFFALLAAAVFAYGTEPIWASLSPHGLDIIIWSRRLEWPLIVTALLLCVGLLIAVVAAKRRVWWLIGLLPVLVLFYHRFTAGPAVGVYCVQDPAFVSIKDAATEAPDDLIVGMIVDNDAYAFRDAALARSPVVITTLREKRVILLWSAFGNRAMAFTVARDLRAEDLEIVSSPDNALLVYNSRLGEFINGITGRTVRGENPSGFHEPIPVIKTTWLSWLADHPDTKLMTGGSATSWNVPNQPRYVMPGSSNDTRRICMVACTQPIAVPSESITDRPLNLTSGQTSLLLVRIDGVVHAFNRDLPGDLVPRFAPGIDPKHKTVAWVDSDTNSKWCTAGSVVEGPAEMHGVAMSSIPVEDDLYWNVMKFWYPDLHLATDAEIAAAGVVKAPTAVEKPTGRKKKTASHG